MHDILKKINKTRIHAIQTKGHSFGHHIPQERIQPLAPPNLANGLVICEIKRASPSAGKLSEIPSPVELASEYVNAGATIISVLTEENHFNGSLVDLMQVKEAHPHITILRKDFILFKEDLEVAYRAGADMVLLIVASFINANGGYEQLEFLYNYACSLGLTPLVEVHDEQEIDIALALRAQLIGINTRNLATFKINRQKAYYLRSLIPATTPVIFESGIRTPYEAYLAGAGNFQGILAGTSLVTAENRGESVSKFISSFHHGLTHKSSFFADLFSKLYVDSRPLIKICGLTRREDAEKAINLGATILGFILDDSPRQITAEKLRIITQGLPPVKKVAVVTSFNKEAVSLLKEGVIDAIQYHGFIDDEAMLHEANYPWYRAVNIKTLEDYPTNSISPFILIDAWSEAKGGSGKTIDSSLVHQINEITEQTTFLAGGINPENVTTICNSFSPALIDLASGVESSPGEKDAAKMAKLFNRVCVSKQETS